MSELFRLGVGIILANRAGQVFVGQRIDTEMPAWQMPQGGIELGESALEAATRELHEEVGTNKFKIIKESADWYTYHLPPALACKMWQGQYAGQRQKWVLCEFLGVDADINLHTEIPEFSAWKWVAPQQLPKVIVPFKRELYKQLVKDFAADIAGLEKVQ